MLVDQNRTWIVLTLVLLHFFAHGQQVPVSLGQVLGFHPEHPGFFPTDDNNVLTISHLQSEVDFFEWTSQSQFLRLLSAPQGKKESFCWGLNLSNDIVHTEQRFSLSPSIAAKIYENGPISASLGISLGFIYRSSNFREKRIYDLDDELIGDQKNFLEIDGGLGGSFNYRTKKVTAEANLYARQLTGNTISEASTAFTLLPHVFSSGRLLFSPLYNVLVGPQFFFQTAMGDTLNADNMSSLDLGAAIEFQRQGLEINTAYRVNSQALALGFRLRIIQSDTTQDHKKRPLELGMNLGTSYPMQNSGAFGPSVEVGLDLRFGKALRVEKDTLRNAVNFWENEASMTLNKTNRLQPNGPPGLKAFSEVVQKKVYLWYEFPDDNWAYVGDAPVVRGEDIIEIGSEWTGVDALLENLITEVIELALHPDSTNIRDPENLEPLRRLSSLGISSEARDDEVGINFGSDVVYYGEVGFDSTSYDTLSIAIVVDDKDTVIQVVRNRIMSILDLACLKLYVMQKKLSYELFKQYGEQYKILLAGEVPFFDEDDEWLPIVRLNKPRLITDNPNQSTMMLTKINLKLLRTYDRPQN